MAVNTQTRDVLRTYWGNSTNDLVKVETDLSTLDAEHTAYSAPGWDDFTMPASGINPPGAVSDPPRSTTTGLLEFSGTADNILAGVMQLPHRWAEGTEIRPHIPVRFTTSTATNTRWKFEYDIASPTGNFTNNSGTYTDGGTITIANPQNVKKHVLGGFTAIAMTGHTLSANVLWKITRLASTDAADNYTGVVELLDFDMHFQTDRPAGSDDEFLK